jgi:hypothetical protein
MAYSRGTVDGFWDEAVTVYKRARKIQPLKILGREVGVTPDTQQLKLVDTDTSGSKVKKYAMYGIGGLVVAKLLKLI